MVHSGPNHMEITNVRSLEECNILSSISAAWAASAVLAEYCRKDELEPATSATAAGALVNRKHNIQSAFNLSDNDTRRIGASKSMKLKTATIAATGSANENLSYTSNNLRPRRHVETGEIITESYKKSSLFSAELVTASVTMFQKQANLKGYQIPKKKNGSTPPVEEERRLQTPIVHDNDLVQPHCIPGKTSLQQQEITSDYGSTNSGDSLDLSDSSNSSNNSGHPTPDYNYSSSSEDASPTIEPSRKKLQHFEHQEKMKSSTEEPFSLDYRPVMEEDGMFEDADYVIITCEDDIEIMDIFTADDDGSTLKVKEGIILQLLDYEDEGLADDIPQLHHDKENNCYYYNCTEEGKPQSPESTNLLAFVSNNFNYGEEMLDLELGAVETVESEESFRSDDDEDNGKRSDDDKVHFDVNLADDVNRVVKFSKPDSHGHSGSDQYRGPCALKSTENKTAKSTSKPHSPTNLLTSVLEKTLLVKLRRCDDSMYMPKDETRCKMEVVPIGELTSDPIEQPPNTQVQGRRLSHKLKRKHKRRVQEEDNWAIVSHSDDLSSNESKCPIKLKITRKRLENDDNGSLEVSSSSKRVVLEGGKTAALSTTILRNTSSPKFYSGFCKVCGAQCPYEEARTYYVTSSAATPFSCCTCFGEFSQSEWTNHNRSCYIVEDLSATAERYEAKASRETLGHSHPTFGDRTVMRRDFICLLCFSFMAK